VKAVDVDGKRYARRSMEEYTPAILVESPLPFETVSNPIRATGTANTFEANFQYELVDPAGKVVDENFVTATSGTGTRGTFDFTTKPYTGKAGEGALVVLELSAKDGSRINEVRIPLQLEP
jgi:germination protein M